MARMKRLQISLEPELDAELERTARIEGVSKAEIVRRSVRKEITPQGSIWDDPLFRMFGTLKGDPNDKRSVDDIVYGPRE
ncbi:MAG: hypothetical protein QOG09_1246 [Solirubrobacterales bacterium]|nr:hypothetical protein [Solirubrobacterales bacterium]MDX6663144.1 hypothetical protein [Solirubrobacterales bacterium]